MNHNTKTALRFGVSALIVLLGACAVEPVEIKMAEKTCSAHGGIKYLYAFPTTEVHCRDGFVANNLKAGST